MRVKLNINISKSYIVTICIVLGIVILGTVFYFFNSSDNPLPANLKKQVTFKVAVPKSKLTKIDDNSYVYQSAQNVLTYNTSYAGTNVAFSQQPAPPSLGDDTQAYYPALGIHPYAQFKVNLGTVALTRFWRSGNLTPTGESAVLATNGTMIIAHAENNLTNEQWKTLFENLTIVK